MHFGAERPVAGGASPVLQPSAHPPSYPVPLRPRTMEEISAGSPGELSIRTTRWRYSLNFFGDTSLSMGRPTSSHPLSFSIGAQDALVKGELGDHFVATAEIAMEAQETGFVVDVERFNVRWRSEHFFIEAGRSHTAVGYWNNAYHHGKWLQPTIDRPRWVEFEDSGGMLPVHWVGIDIGAKLSLGAATLNLVASVGNGRGVIVDDVRNTGDYQSQKAVHVQAELVGLGAPDLRIGVAGVADRIPGQSAVLRPALPDRPIDELIGSAHVAYASVPLLFITEGYAVLHRADGSAWVTYGGFALLGYAFGRYTPYLQFERIASSGGRDPFFSPGRPDEVVASFDTAEGIVGIRIDLSDWTALKGEYRFTRALDTTTDLQEGLLNWSWGF